MDAAVMSFHLSLSPTSSSSLTRFLPVVMPYNDKLALFKSFSILSIRRCFGRPTGRFPTGHLFTYSVNNYSMYIVLFQWARMASMYITQFAAGAECTSNN